MLSSPLGIPAVYAIHAAYIPEPPCKEQEDRARRTFSQLFLNPNTAAWKPDLFSCFSGANELINWSTSYNTVAEEPTAGKPWTSWSKIELNKDKHPKLPPTSLKVTLKCFIFRSPTNKKLLRGRSTETRHLLSSKSFREFLSFPLSLSDLKPAFMKHWEPSASKLEVFESSTLLLKFIK